MIGDIFKKIFNIRFTQQGMVLTLFGEEYVPIKSVEQLVDRNKILSAALEKRVMTIKIMESRLVKNKDLIERMHNALEAQNQQLHKQMDIINTQRQQLKQLDRIDWHMKKLKHEQNKLKKIANGQY